MIVFRKNKAKLLLTTGLIVLFSVVLFANVGLAGSEKEEELTTCTFLFNLPFLHTWDASSVLIKPNISLSKNIWDRLIERDEKDNLIPSLATEWRQLSDTQWELKLREGVKWHDGSEFNAKDVKASLERYSDPTRESQYAGFYAFEQFDVKIKDPYTVVVDTKRPMAVFKKYLTLVSIMKKETIEAEDWETYPVGTGPFKVVKVEGEKVIMDAFQDYWNGAPKIDRLVWDYVEDSDTRIAALQAGEADIIVGIPPDKDKIIEDDPDLSLYRVSSDEMRILFIRGPLFKDVRVRQAAAYAIDRDKILKTIEVGKGVEATAHYPRGLLGWANMKDKTGIEYEYNPSKARQLLEEANYDFDAPLKYVTTPYFPKQLEVSQAITEYLKAVGFNVQLQAGEAGAWLDGHSNPEVALLDTGWPTHFWDPDEHLYMWIRAMWGWSSMYEDAGLEKLMMQQDQLVDENRRAAFISEKILPRLWREMPGVLPLYERTVSWATRKEVKGFPVYGSEMETRFYTVSFEE
jgi:peptide/nickel transport system substrate-binding protein